MDLPTREAQFLAPWNPSVMLAGDPGLYGGLEHPLFNIRGKFVSADVDGNFRAYVMGIDSGQSETAAFVVELDQDLLSKSTLDDPQDVLQMPVGSPP